MFIQMFLNFFVIPSTVIQATTIISKEELIKFLEDENVNFFKNTECSVCYDSLFNCDIKNDPEIEKKRIITEIEKGGIKKFTTKYLLLICNHSHKHLFHDECLMKSIETGGKCPLCNLPLVKFSFKIYRKLVWNRFCDILPSKQMQLIQKLNFMGMIELIDIFKLLKFKSEGFNLNDLKEMIQNQPEFNLIRRMIDVFQRESNDLVFASYFILNRYTTDIMVIFSSENISKLSIDQIFDIAENVNDTSDASTKNLQKYIFSLLQSKLIGLDQKNIIRREFSFEEYKTSILRRIGTTAGVSFIYLVFKGMEPDHSFSIGDFLIFATKCIKELNFCKHKMNRLLLSYLRFYNLTYNDFKNMKELRFCFDENYDSQVADTHLVDFLRKSLIFAWFFNEHLKIFISENSSIKSYFFNESKSLINASDSYFIKYIGSQSFDLKSLEEIIKNPFLRPKLIDYLDSYSHIEDFITLNVIGTIVESKEKDYLENIVDNLIKTLSMSYFEFLSMFLRPTQKSKVLINHFKSKILLEEFIKRCAKRKLKEIIIPEDLVITLQIFSKYPYLLYLGYFFLTDSDFKMEKNTLNDCKIDQIIESILLPRFFKIFAGRESSFDVIFFTSFSYNFFRVLYKYGIPPKKIYFEIIKIGFISEDLLNLSLKIILKNFKLFSENREINLYILKIFKILKAGGYLNHENKTRFNSLVKKQKFLNFLRL